LQARSVAELNWNAHSLARRHFKIRLHGGVNSGQGMSKPAAKPASAEVTLDKLPLVGIPWTPRYTECPMNPEPCLTRLLCACTVILLLLGGCAGQTPQLELPLEVEQQRLSDLNLAILALGDGVDAGEARRAAKIAIDYSRQLAREYEITGSALAHNIKVNLGIKQRGLCVDWTRDLLARMKQEEFHSLDLHWAIANYETLFRLEHSTLVISARGNSLHQGLILDPWRNSGHLYWASTLGDPGYQWKPQAEIHALKRQHAAATKNPSYLR